MLISDWSSDVASSDLQGGSRIPVGRQNDAEAEQGGDQHELAERDPGQPRHCYGEIAGPDDVGDGQREETAFQKLVGNGGSIRQRPQSQRRQRQAGGEELLQDELLEHAQKIARYARIYDEGGAQQRERKNVVLDRKSTRLNS